MIEPVRFQPPAEFPEQTAEVIPLPMLPMPGMDTIPAREKPRTVANAPRPTIADLIPDDMTADASEAAAELAKMDKDTFLKLLSNEQLTCRAYVHLWSIPVPGKKLPKGYSHTPNRDGSYRVKHTCSRCQETRTKDTLRGGFEDPEATWSYHYPDGWPHFPVEMHIHKIDARNEYNRRLFAV